MFLTLWPQYEPFSVLYLGVTSGYMILLKITSKLRQNLQNISRRVILIALMNMSPANIFQFCIWPKYISKSYRPFLGCCRHEWVKITSIWHGFTKNLKDNYGLGSDPHFSLKYFQKNVSVTKLAPK